jgi:O-antigen/teichoic acid export membrane protein
LNSPFKISSVSEFKKNVITLFSGTIISQAIPIVAAPLFTRIYSPNDYAIFGVFLAISAVINIFSTFNFPAAIIVSENDLEAKQLLYLSGLISIFMAFLSFILVCFLNNQLGLFFNIAEMNYLLYFIPIILLLYGFNFGLIFYCQRKKLFGLISKSKIYATIASVLISLFLGILISGPIGLITGAILNYFVGITFISFHLHYKEDFFFQNILTKHDIHILFKKYKSFPIYTMPTDFINIFINQLPVFVLSKFDPISVAFYNLSNRVLGTPTQFLSSSIGDAFRQKIIEQKRITSDCSSYYKRTLKGLVLLSIIPFSILFFIAPQFFGLVFGDKWANAGYFTQILIPLFFAKFLVLPFVTIYTIAMKQREDFLMHIYLLTSSIIIFSFGFYMIKNINMMLLLFSLNYALIYVVYLLRSYRFSKSL